MPTSKRITRVESDLSKRPGIQFLVESALREVVSGKARSHPRCREEWLEYLIESLLSDSETAYVSAVASLAAAGVTREILCSDYIPALARRLGEMWVSDRINFVDVTLAAGRLQQHFRGEMLHDQKGWTSRSIPLGHSALMVIPKFEQHSLGAFIAADSMRRHGIWVHMAIGLDAEEVANSVRSCHFSMVGLTLGTPASVEKARDYVDAIRSGLDAVPPIVVGGRVVECLKNVASRVGSDLTARTAREAIEGCGLATVLPMAAMDHLS